MGAGCYSIAGALDAEFDNVLGTSSKVEILFLGLSPCWMKGRLS